MTAADEQHEPLTPQLNLSCEGTPWAMGVAQGNALRAKIVATRQALAKLEAFRLLQPNWLPYPLYRAIAERRARRFLRTALSGQATAAERMAGMAEGAGLSLGAVSLLNALEPVMADARGISEISPLGGCSALAVRNSRSAGGEPILVKNFDYLPLVQPFYVLREDRPRGGWRSLQFTLAPLVGAVDGVNERGLALTYNYAFAVDQPSTAPPVSMLLADVLTRCETVAEAAAWMESRPRCGAGLVMLADAAGDIASLELSHTRSALRRPVADEDVIFHSNCYVSETMRQVEVARDAVFSAKAPQAQRGRRVQQSPEMRQARLAELTRGPGRWGPDDLARLMADHGAEDLPQDDTLCMHGSYWFTTACLQWFPVSRRVRVAYDTACRARYVEFSL
jgi:hypothetical protein